LKDACRFRQAKTLTLFEREARIRTVDLKST
jgi:hypothetical protein